MRKEKNAPGLDERLAPKAPTVLAGLVCLLLVGGLYPRQFNTPLDFAGFGKLPVLNGGRIKPLDTMARTALLSLSGKQTLAVEGGRKSALSWLFDMLFAAGAANEYRVFEIDDPDVLGLLGMRVSPQRRFSFIQLAPHFGEIETQTALASEVKPAARSRYQAAVLALRGKMELYQKLQNTLQVSGAVDTAAGLQYLAEHLNESAKFAEQFGFLASAAEFYPLPEADFDNGEPLKWLSVGESVVNSLSGAPAHVGVAAYAVMGDAYRDSDENSFNRALGDYQTWLSVHAPKSSALAGWEYAFNSFDPFYKSLLIYLAAFLLIFVSWLVLPRTLSRAAFALMVLAFVVHTAGLFSRILLQGRPPVTNLYSSAIFVGWVAVLLGLALERVTRRGIGTMVASAIGALTLIVAVHLDTQGDTMEMMRAVLDSNFWLATHVTCITIGYSSTFLSGALGIYYILQRRFASRRGVESAATVEKMAFGVVCFSMFFSFLGTILGGIWADQSWGRFWGWDPKENGALMIVLWNATILHARWGKVVGPRGFMVMAVFGNIVTALSWFGVNMLGIGLHSYGFMDKAFVWLMAFVASQTAIMAAAFLPARD